MHRSNPIFSVALGLALAGGGAAQERPPIVGVAHIALKTGDLAAARDFYGKYLGYEVAFALAESDGGPQLTYFKVNDRQYIEVLPELKSETEDRLSHIAFETTNVRQLRDYLASRGVEVPATVRTLPDGNLSVAIKDADGHTVEFVQYMPGSLEIRDAGKSLPASRISERISHVGFTVSDRAAADHLFKDILGFHEVWHGGFKDDGPPNWVAMRVPDGKDHLEYMLMVSNPSPQTLGVMNHLCLGVPSVDASYKILLARGMKIAAPPKIGRDGKWQLNLYDPNFTRAELMEPKPVQKPCCSPFLD
jgi:catechol 2,3-dioxygenase-like lactoylglutathione lyase family enzyme